MGLEASGRDLWQKCDRLLYPRSNSSAPPRSKLPAGGDLDADAEGAAIWRQIAAAVEELQRERRPGERVN